MSYLVDALKKAERERHENQRADLRSLAEGGAIPQGLASGRALRWLVGLLVVCNAALLVYLFIPARMSEAFVASESSVVSSGAGTRAPATPSGAPAVSPSSGAAEQQRTQTPAPARSQPIAANARPAPAVKSAGTARTPAPQPSSKTLPPTRSVRRDEAMPSLRLTEQAAPRRGQVTYSQTPLDGKPSLSARDTRPQRDRPVANSAPAGPAPEITINGHLYSTVPGRSFILVGGRRYHEGERLAAGPAVESIDATGATLNYGGDRYHVKGPS